MTGSALSELLQPVSTVHPPPADPATARYVRSYLIMRALVGALGIALPFVLVLVDGVWFDGHPFPRTSLSAYYYSGVRELFVGTLCAIAVFLITYKVAEINLDNTLSILAGLAALLVALCPTARPGPAVGQTPLQQRLGETFVSTIHFTAAATFISALALLSFYFGKREGARAPVAGKRSPRFWRTFHWSCAATVAVALAWSAITELTGWGPSRSLLYGEAVAVWAFGTSWLWKGLELDLLRMGRS